MYIYNIVTGAWFGAGTMCIGRYAGKDEEQWLLNSGIANGTAPEVAKKYGFGPCLTVPTLEKAFALTKHWLASLKPEDRKELLAHRGR